MTEGEASPVRAILENLDAEGGWTAQASLRSSRNRADLG